MIVKMKKVSIVMLDSDRQDNVQKLEKLGLVHVDTASELGENYANLKKQYSLLTKAFSLLPPENKKEHSAQTIHHKQVSLPTALEYSKRIIQRSAELKQNNDRLKKLRKYIEEITVWGDYIPDDIDRLRSAGVNMVLGKVPAGKYKKFGNDYDSIILGSTKKNIFVVLLNPDPEKEFPDYFNIYQPPEKSLEQYRKELVSAEKDAAKTEQELHSLFRHRKFLADSIVYMNNKLEFSAVYNSMSQHEELAVINGFIPSSKISEIKKYCSKSGWAVLVTDPADGDNVPTLVRNKRAVGIVRPVFSLMGTVPGYLENDISFMFLLFFSLFFAMIIGDGAYGCIILFGSLAGIIPRLVKRKQIPDTLFLFALMGFTTVVWGTVTGTWFGSEKIAALPGLKRLIIKSLYVHDSDSEFNVKYFCFIIGTVHISIAHIWNIIKGIKNRIGLKVIAQFGWLSLVLGLYNLVLYLVLDPVAFELKPYALPMMAGGLGAVILFGNQEGNFFKGIAKGFAGLITTVLDAIGSFSDIISYIRLFAVGLASVEIAKSFNAMAQAASASLGDGTIYQILASSLILFAGHTLNLGMGALSVIVHGVRLNMLEFSGHLGMEWTGIEYKPFGRKEAN